jgi:hypothetical protein
VRLPGGGYVPVIVVRHRVTDPGSGAFTSALPETDPRQAVPDPARKSRTQTRDLMRLAHLHRMLEDAGWAPAPGEPFGRHGGVVGLDADVVVWHDLAAEHWPGQRSTLAEYDARFADRVAVATAAATGAPALARPSRVMECRRCPWWPTCEAELVREQDVSLVVRGDAATALRAAGITSVARLAALSPTAEPLVPMAGASFPDLVALARAWQRGLTVVRRVSSVPVRRADVEVDVDMESFGESGAYLWGALLTRPGGTLPDDEPDGYRAFATWEPVPTPDEARSFAAFWTWLIGVRDRATATGRTFAAYCYNDRRRPLAARLRPAGSPGSRDTGRRRGGGVHRGRPVDNLFAVVGEWFLCAHGKGLKRIAPAAGFAGATPRPVGRTPCAGTGRGRDGRRPPDPTQRGGCWSTTPTTSRTRALREWMTSPAVEEVRWRRTCSAGHAGPGGVRGRTVDGPPDSGSRTPPRGCSVRGRDPKLFPGSRASARSCGRGGGMGGCPFSGGAATVAETSVSRRRVLAGAAGLAVVPVLAGIAPASAASVVPAPVPTPAPTTAPPRRWPSCRKAERPRVRTASATRAARTSP